MRPLDIVDGHVPGVVDQQQVGWLSGRGRDGFAEIVDGRRAFGDFGAVLGVERSGGRGRHRGRYR